MVYRVLASLTTASDLLKIMKQSFRIFENLFSVIHIHALIYFNRYGLASERSPFNVENFSPAADLAG